MASLRTESKCIWALNAPKPGDLDIFIAGKNGIKEFCEREHGFDLCEFVLCGERCEFLLCPMTAVHSFYASFPPCSILYCIYFTFVMHSAYSAA